MNLHRRYMDKLCFFFFFCYVLVVSFSFVNGGNPKDDEIGIYELKNGNMTVKFTNWGATIISLVLPDKNGKPGDIVLGYDSVKDYMNDTTYFGGVVGRFANRIGGAKFYLNGVEYKLPANDGKNTLHGGLKGFSDVIWKVNKFKKDAQNPSIISAYDSKDSEQGFPGKVKVMVRYLLLSDNRLRVTMRANALEQATPVNLAQHTYWNLGNHDSGDILSEEIQLFASRITPVDKELIPTGVISPVRGTPYDFLESERIGSQIKELKNGYDINYAIDGPQDAVEMKKTAIVKDGKSGRVMKLYTNQPGVQFYTGNMIKDVKGKGGFIYKAHAGLCLETQGFPDSVNRPNFPSQIISPGKPYEHKMLFKFSIASQEKYDK